MQLSTKEGIEEKRVVNAQENLKTMKRLLCGICLDMLWKPVSCATCHTNYCEACISRWLSNNRASGVCPNRCKYVKESSPPIILDLLSDFQITCIHKENGCNEIVLYDQLEKHEVNCGYQPKKCRGCQTEIPQIKLSEHEESCELIEIQCEGCKVKLTKRNFGAHDRVECLTNSLRQKDEEIAHSKMIYEQVIQEQEKQIKRLTEENSDLKQKLLIKNAKDQQNQVKPLISVVSQSNKKKPSEPLYNNKSQAIPVHSGCPHNWKPAPTQFASCNQCFRTFVGGMFSCAACGVSSCHDCKSLWK